MAKSSLRLKLGSIYQKHSTDNYYFRYQFNGHRKCVSLNTKNREMALRKAEKLQPIVQATIPFIRTFFSDGNAKNRTLP